MLLLAMAFESGLKLDNYETVTPLWKCCESLSKSISLSSVCFYQDCLCFVRYRLYFLLFFWWFKIMDKMDKFINFGHPYEVNILLPSASLGLIPIPSADILKVDSHFCQVQDKETTTDLNRN